MSPSAIKACRPNVVRNHYITLQQLNGLNPGLDLSSVLRATDPEHLLVAERALFHAIKSLVRVPVLYASSSVSYLALRTKSACSTMLTVVFRPPSRMSRFVPISTLAPLHPESHPCPALPLSRSCFPLLRTSFPPDPRLSLQRGSSPSLCHARPPLLLHARPHPPLPPLRPPPVPPLPSLTHRLWLASVLIHRLAARRWQYQPSSLPASVALNRAASLLVLLQELTTAKAVDAFLQANGSLSDSDVLSAALLLLEPGRDGLFDEWVLQVARVDTK